nr:hypothetical protein [Burkholderia gladioli]
MRRQAAAQVGGLAVGQVGVEAAHVEQGLAAEQGVAHAVERVAERHHAVQVDHRGVMRLVRQRLAALAAHRRALRVQARQRGLREVPVEQGVGAQEQHRVGMRGVPAGVADRRARGGLADGARVGRDHPRAVEGGQPGIVAQRFVGRVQHLDRQLAPIGAAHAAQAARQRTVTVAPAHHHGDLVRVQNSSSSGARNALPTQQGPKARRSGAAARRARRQARAVCWRRRARPGCRRTSACLPPDWRLQRCCASKEIAIIAWPSSVDGLNFIANRVRNRDRTANVGARQRVGCRAGRGFWRARRVSPGRAGRDPQLCHRSARATPIV